jgi:hypothetical protein
MFLLKPECSELFKKSALQKLSIFKQIFIIGKYPWLDTFEYEFFNITNGGIGIMFVTMNFRFKNQKS